MISIITPVYNGEQHIESCLKAVIDQNCSNIEHIIVDGGSTDRTVEIIKRYANICPHIRWISEKDQGQSDAMNKGIIMAKSEIISFLNVDDFYQPNVLNRVLEITPSLPNPSILVGNCNVWDAQDKLSYVCKPVNFRFSNMLQGLNARNFPTNPSAYFYHTSLHQQVGMYKVDEHYAMDLDFLLRAVQVANIKYINETWGNWMRTENTKTSILWQTCDRGYELLDNILRYYRKDLPPLQRYMVAIKYEIGSFWERKFQWRFKYYFEQYLKAPQNIPPKLSSKIMSFWSTP
jgi:glycosyltransferase involved in cell wall biosynthesis